jgi:hypothetical protein
MNLTSVAALAWLAAGLMTGMLDRCGLHAMQAPRSDSRASITNAWYGDERNVAPALIERGRQLRHALETRVDTQARASVDGLNAQRELVLGYIPQGTVFADAEAILRAAGLDVSSRGPLNTITGKGEHGVRARLDFIMAMTKEEIEIELLPASTSDWHVAQVRTRRRFEVG